MSTFKIAIFGFFLLITLASGSKCPQEDAAKLVVCYYKGETSLSNFNICSCTHVVFTNGVKKGENNSISLNEGAKRNLDLIKKKKDDVSALFTLEIKSNDASIILKSENRSSELITEIANLLQESKFNGVELNFKFNSEDGVSKESYVSFVKKLSKTLSSSHTRVKREGYDVFEKVQDDVTTAAYTTQTPKNSTSRTQSINRRDRTKKSRNTREDRDNAAHTEKISLEEAINSEFFSEKPTESKISKDPENEKNKFFIFIRLSVEPEIIAKKFDLKHLGRYADILLVPTHDIVNKNEDHLTYHPSRLMGLSDMLNTDSVLDFLTGIGAPKSKIVITMPLTVLKFQLKDITKNTPRSPSTTKPQVIDQSQLCSLLSKNKNWTVERDDDLTAPYAYSGKTWLAFEDEISIGIKGKYILLRELAGGAVYPIDADTNDGSCLNRTRSGFLVEILHNNFQNLGRKPRALVLENLQEEIHSTRLSGIEAGVTHSEYRIIRVVDHSGAVHIIRKNTKTQFECSRQGYFSHPLGCNKFYRCVKFDQYSDEFTVFEYDCPAGLAFDERWEVCVWPGSLPNGAPCTGSSEIAPVPRSHYRCPNQEGYYPDPENCRWFFACLDHAHDGVTPLTAYEFRCPFGLVFNEEKLACDWPWLVGACGNRGAAGFLKTHTEFINGGNLAASSGQYGSLEQEATFHGFGRGFGSGLGLYGGAQSAGFGYIGSGIDDNQNRASFGSFPDYEVSGGRIFNKGGVILGQHIVGVAGTSGNSDGSLYTESAGSSNIIPGSTGAANKQSGFLYHRNSQSSYGQGSISVSTPTINIPAQNEYTGHSTVAANNLLVEYGQRESYRGDASFQDAVTTPKPFSVDIPKVQINQEVYTGHSATAADALLAAKFGQKESIKEFSKLSVVTPKTEAHIFGNAVASGGSVITPIGLGTTPVSPTFKAAGISELVNGKGYIFGNENIGGVSSVTPKPNVNIFDHASPHAVQNPVGGTHGESFQQSINVQPGVSVSTPFSFSTTPRPSGFKSIDQGFRSSSEHSLGFSDSVGVTPQVILNTATPKPEIQIKQISGDAVKIQDFGQGNIHFSTPQSNFESVASGISVTQPILPVTVGYTSESERYLSAGGSVTPLPEKANFGYKTSYGEQRAVNVRGPLLKQSGVSLSTPISFSTTPRLQDIKPVEVSFGQSAITTGHSLEHSSGDVNFGGSVTSIPGVHTFEYTSSLDRKAINGHGVFGQKFNIQPNVQVGAVKPQNTLNVVNQPVNPHIDEYSVSFGTSGPSTVRPRLQTFEHSSSGQINEQSLGKEFSAGTVSYIKPIQTLRPIAEVAVNQPALPVGGEYSHQHTGHLEGSNTPQSGLSTFEFTSTLGKQTTKSAGFGQSDVLVHSPPSISTTLKPLNNEIQNQPALSIGVGYSFDKHASGHSGRNNGAGPVVSSTVKPFVGFEQTSAPIEFGKQDGRDDFVSFVSTVKPPNFKSGDVSVTQTGYSIGHGTGSTSSEPLSFGYASSQGEQSTVGGHNVVIGQSLAVQPVSVSSPVTFNTSPKPDYFKPLGVSVTQPVSGFSVSQVTPGFGVRTFESNQSLKEQGTKISQPFTPRGGIYSYDSGLRVSTPKSVFKETSFSKGKEGSVRVSSGQFVTPAVQVFKNTGGTVYSHELSRIATNPFEQNIDAKVSNEINLNKDVTYGVPIRTSESGLFDGTFGAKTATPLTPTVVAPTLTPIGKQFSSDSFNLGGLASFQKITSTPRQQEILTELSIEQQPIISIGSVDTFKYDGPASTPGPNVVSQIINNGNFPPKTAYNYQQQTLSPSGNLQNVKSFSSTVKLQQPLVPVTESKSYLPPVTPKTNIFRSAAQIVPFKSVGIVPQEENFEFLKTQVNEFKPGEVEITKSFELNPKQFYKSTSKPIVVQQQPVHLLSEKTYSFGVTQSFGKDKVQASVSSTSIPVSSSTVKTIIENERVALRGEDDITSGLFRPNVQIKTASPAVSQIGQLHIVEQPVNIPLQKEGEFIQTHNSFDFQKIKSAQQPQYVFGSQNITRFSLNPNIEIPEPPQEYLSQYSTQSSVSPTKSRLKSTKYLPPENDNIQEVLNKYNGRFGQIAKERGSTSGDEASSTTQKPKPRGRQYHGSITSNLKATNKYEEYDINGQGRSDSKTTIDLTNLKLDKDKKTVIVVSQVSDANPILIGKLAGQCSCQSNVVELKTKGKQASNKKNLQITNQFLPPIESSLQVDASTPESVVIEGKSVTTPQPVSSTILSSLSPDGVLTITPKSVYAGSLKNKQFRGRARYLTPSVDLLSAVPASEIASTVDYASARNEIDDRSGGAAFDRYGPGGWRSFDETLQGSVDCKRPGLFRHPKYCNKFYSCNYDPWKERYVLHVFNCPIHLAYDSSISACNWPVRGPACADDNLLV